MSLFAPRPKDDMKSRNSLWKAVPGLIFFLYVAFHFAFKAAGERDAASREQTSLGLFLDCNKSSKGENYCHYMFSAGDKKYSGVSQVASDVGFGQTVTVHYDSQDPTVNSLEDFSAKSRSDENWFYMSLIVIVAFVARIFHLNFPRAKN